jgi:hypothetical protein
MKPSHTGRLHTSIPTTTTRRADGSLTVSVELPPGTGLDTKAAEKSRRRTRDLLTWLRARQRDRFASYRGTRQPQAATNALFDSLCEEAQDWLTDPDPTPTQVCPLMAHAVHRWVDSLT